MGKTYCAAPIMEVRLSNFAVERAIAPQLNRAGTYLDALEVPSCTTQQLHLCGAAITKAQTVLVPCLRPAPCPYQRTPGGLHTRNSSAAHQRGHAQRRRWAHHTLRRNRSGICARHRPLGKWCRWQIEILSAWSLDGIGFRN
jgi:hypothetical protein